MIIRIYGTQFGAANTLS